MQIKYFKRRPLNTQPSEATNGKLDEILFARVNNYYNIYLTSWVNNGKCHLGYRICATDFLMSNDDYRWKKRDAFKAAIKEVKKEIAAHQRELLNAN